MTPTGFRDEGLRFKLKPSHRTFLLRGGAASTRLSYPLVIARSYMPESPQPDESVRHLNEFVCANPDGSAPALVTLSPEASLRQIVAVIEADGGVIIRDFLSPDLLQRLQYELRPFVEESAPGSKETPALERVPWTQDQAVLRLAQVAGIRRVDAEPRPKGICRSFLLPRCGSYWLNTGQMMVIGPGEPAQMLHRDSANRPHFPWPAPEVTVSRMFALNDFDAESGATQGRTRKPSMERPEPRSHSGRNHPGGHARGFGASL